MSLAAVVCAVCIQCMCDVNIFSVKNPRKIAVVYVTVLSCRIFGACIKESS